MPSAAVASPSIGTQYFPVGGYHRARLPFWTGSGQSPGAQWGGDIALVLIEMSGSLIFWLWLCFRPRYCITPTAVPLLVFRSRVGVVVAVVVVGFAWFCGYEAIDRPYRLVARNCNG